MTVVVSLSDYRPSPRYDDLAWTQARLQSATTEDGAYTTVETFTLSPVDDDPTQPARRNFTSEDVPDAAEYVRIVWVDASGDIQETEPLAIGSSAHWRPTVDDVAALLRARTKPTDGQTPLGTFGATTRPTDTEVRELIEQAVGDVESRTGTVVEAYRTRAAKVAALYAAMLVELSYFPEQIDTDQSPYDRLKELYDEAIVGLIEAIRGNAPRKGLFSVPLRSDALDPIT